MSWPISEKKIPAEVDGLDGENSASNNNLTSKEIVDVCIPRTTSVFNPLPEFN